MPCMLASTNALSLALRMWLNMARWQPALWRGDGLSSQKRMTAAHLFSLRFKTPVSLVATILILSLLLMLYSSPDVSRAGWSFDPLRRPRSSMKLSPKKGAEGGSQKAVLDFHAALLKLPGFFSHGGTLGGEGEGPETGDKRHPHLGHGTLCPNDFATCCRASVIYQADMQHLRNMSMRAAALGIVLHAPVTRSLKRQHQRAQVHTAEQALMELRQAHLDLRTDLSVSFATGRPWKQENGQWGQLLACSVTRPACRKKQDEASPGC